MIPLELHQLPNMAAILAARGEVAAELYRCKCKRDLPPESFACTDGLPGGLPRFVCYTCASHAHRLAIAAQEQAAAAQLAAWDTEQGKACKAERDRRVNATLWTTADGSPLADDCRAAWCVWRQAMHRITVDLPGPIPNDSGDWPQEPGYDYCTTP